MILPSETVTVQQAPLMLDRLAVCLDALVQGVDTGQTNSPKFARAVQSARDVLASLAPRA